ncbi:glucokinase [Nocardioides thalensis]|uniref:Glucokinase n=1 Tax=Nocardioides thalensis TaxID=1914755 RepID=A0A853C3Q2_9ACTN|nr:glucokinase [Nocardioides thalensis]
MLVGVDVGGTKVLAVELPFAGPDVAPVRTAQRPMPGREASDTAVEDAVVGAVLDLADGRPIEMVGVSAAGLVDARRGRVMFGAHVPWRDAPVRDRLESRLAEHLRKPGLGTQRAGRTPLPALLRHGPSVVIDNDANCAAYAEIVAGAARGASSALMVTVGTGIGGAVIIGGQVVHGHHGFAGEFGHMRVVPDGRPCECGLRGCWEQYCSGRALERAVRLTLGPDVVGKDVAAMARAGDETARDAIAGIGEWLGTGLAGLVSALDPERVIVGGGVSSDGDLLLDPARRMLAESLQGTAYRAVPPIVAAKFGPEAGAVGAALLVRAVTRGRRRPRGPWATAASASPGTGSLRRTRRRAEGRPSRGW